MKKIYLSFLTLSALALSPQLYAQQAPLPKGLTTLESELISGFNFRNSRRTAPPVTPVRTAAEWEEVEYLVVTWDPAFQNILSQIVTVGAAECKVIITTQDEASVVGLLTAQGADLSNVIFLDVPFNSIWTRDYSGNTVYSNDVGQRALVDWIYNRPRPLDNAMPSAHATQAGIPIYITDSGTNDLVNTGGNFMSDGLGNAFASELILEENAVGNPYGVTAKTEAQIDNIMEDYMGITNFIKMPVLPFDGIHHIDMHMKLLDEETLLVSRYPAGVADGPQIEDNIEYVLDNFVSSFGTPYNVKWIDAPPSVTGNYPDSGGAYRTYSNALILNRSVLVPTYRPEVDGPALALYEELMPGYNIVGIDVDNPAEPLIELSGALHCITHTIGVPDPLLIVHQPVKEAAAGTAIPINASIRHASGISGAKVIWRETGTAEFTETVMAAGEDNNWTATITTDAEGTDVEYYIWAQANTTRTSTRPLVAPEGFWTINSQALSIEEWAAKSISAPYPNPATDKVNFNLNQVQGPIKVSITNILGQRLYTNSIEDGDGIITLNLNPEWNGTLLIIFEGEFGMVTKKIIKM